MIAIENKLFRKQFELISSLPLQDCVDRLHNLQEPMRNVFTSGTEVTIFEVAQDQFSVDAQTFRNGQRGYYTTVRMTGVIQKTSDDNSLLSGEIKFEQQFLVRVGYGIVATLLFFVVTSRFSYWGDPRFNLAYVVIFPLAIIIYAYWMLNTDAQSLINKVKTAMLSE
jgi:hypothetical protein